MKPYSALATVFKALWTYTADRRGLLASVYLSSTVAKILALTGPFIIGQIVNILQEQGKNGAMLAIKWVIAFALTRFIISWIDAFVNLLQMRFSEMLNLEVKKDFYFKTQGLPLLWHQNHHSGNITSRMYAASSAVSAFVYLPLQFVELIVGFVGPIVILMAISPVVAAITCFMSVASVFVSRFFDLKIRNHMKITNAVRHILSATLNDYISNIRTIVTLRLGLQTVQDISKRVADLSITYRRESAWRASRWIAMDFFVETVVIACMAYMIFAFSKDTYAFKIGDLVMAITYLRNMSSAMYNSFHFSNSLSESVTNYEDFDLVKDAYDDHREKHKTNERQLSDWSITAVKNLSFTYQMENHSTALNNLSFILKRNKKIALVGTSGSGKSTLMSVLRGLYPPQTGMLDIDGNTCPSIEPLASISTLIPQDPEIFENTIRYNITLGIEHSEEEINEACRIACFESVLKELPNGLDSKINEKGVNLSGGQKQRLALARGIFAIQNSSLVLLDEPTSSVDSLTERQIYQNLFEAFPHICLISSIHRLNLLPLFDEIWLMEKGRIIQQGLLADLTTNQGTPFAALWAAYNSAAEN